MQLLLLIQDLPTVRREYHQRVQSAHQTTRLQSFWKIDPSILVSFRTPSHIVPPSQFPYCSSAAYKDTIAVDTESELVYIRIQLFDKFIGYRLYRIFLAVVSAWCVLTVSHPTSLCPMNLELACAQTSSLHCVLTYLGCVLHKFVQSFKLGCHPLHIFCYVVLVHISQNVK